MLKSIEYLQQQGGVLVFLNNKNQQQEKMKNFGIGAQILNKLGIKKIDLLTSGGKHSFIGINGFGLEVDKEINIEG